MTDNESIQLDFFEFLTVRQPSFEGPLDLLLNLIRRKKMDIWEITLSSICEPYLQYVRQMKEFNMEVAVEFLNMASTLILIKSRSLLPPSDDNEDEENPMDTEEQLKQKLVAYKRVKDWAELFWQRDILGTDVFTRPEPDEEPDDLEDLIFEDLTVYGLLKSYQKLGQKKSFLKSHKVTKEEISIEDRMIELGKFLQTGREFLFHEMIKEPHNKSEWILSFMAIMELTKMLFTQIYQAQEFSHIYIKPHENKTEAFQGLKEFLKEQ